MKESGVEELCFGKDYNEAIFQYFEIKKVCYEYILKQYFKLSGKKGFDVDEMSDFAFGLKECLI